MARKSRARKRGPSPVLGVRDRSIIRSINQAHVSATFAGLERFLASDQWLGRTNRYSQNTVGKIKSDLKIGGIRSPRQLAQYIAASSLLHGADGWSYLGKAVAALLRGDPHRSRHLAYYAELRAALSILASRGIGIINHQHFVISAENQILRLNTQRGTHEVVWSCLEYWAKRPSSGQLFSTVVTPYGRQLADWLTPLGGGGTVAAQVQEWFRLWGVDLKVFADDRDARNVSSYRPDGIPTSWKLDPSKTLEFVRSIWESFEPSSNSIFEEIDREILRLALESKFQGQLGIDPKLNSAKFGGWLKQVVDYQGLSDAAATQWSSYLTRQVAQDDSAIFRFAKDSPTDPDSHFGVLSRAALLLRLAVGSTRELVDQAGIRFDSLEFWAHEFGKSRGIWDDDTKEHLTNLWADIPPLLQDVEAFQAKYAVDQQTFFRSGAELSPAIVGLTSFERVALWSVLTSS